jgi:hypothetical protein
MLNSEADMKLSEMGESKVMIFTPINLCSTKQKMQFRVPFLLLSTTKPHKKLCKFIKNSFVHYNILCGLEKRSICILYFMGFLAVT